MDNADNLQVAVVCVFVELEPNEETQRRRERLKITHERSATAASSAPAAHYQMYGRLSATLTNGRVLETGIRDIGWGGPWHGLGAIAYRYRGPLLSPDPEKHLRLLKQTYRVGIQDIKDHVEGMLGRDPDRVQRLPLPYARLIEVLQSEGVTASEADLVATPLEIHLSEAVRERIAA